MANQLACADCAHHSTCIHLHHIDSRKATCIFSPSRFAVNQTRRADKAEARVKELEETVSKQRDKIADFARCLEAHVQELEAAVAIYDSVYDREMSEPGDDISASLAVQLVKAEAKVKELVARVAYLEDELSQCEICDRSLLVSEVESKDLDAAVGSVKTLVCGHCWNDVNRRGGE